MPFSEDTFGRLSYIPNGPDSDFPVKSMPEAMGDSIIESARDLNVPLVLVAQSAIPAWALACQRLIDVQCGSFPPAPTGGFHVTLVQSSRGKSTIVQRKMHPFRSSLEREGRQFEASDSERRADQALWEVDRVILQKQYEKAKPESDERRRLRAQFKHLEMHRPKELEVQQMYYKDIKTPAGLREAFVLNPSVGIVCPDAEPFFDELLSRDMAAVTESWSGEGGTVGLAGGDRRIFKPRLILLLMIQTERFSNFMKRRGDQAFDSGFFGRCLFAHPIIEDVPGTPVPTGTGYLPKLSVFHNRISETLRLPISRTGATTLTLSKEAELRWTVARQWVYDNMICSADYSEQVKRFFRRMDEHYTRLAAQFHYFESPDDPVISVKAMNSAIEVCEWYMWEFIRIFSRYSASDKQVSQSSAERLRTWLSYAIENPMRYPELTPGRYTLRNLQQYAPFRNKSDLNSAIDLLASQGVLTIGSGRRGGRVVYFPPMSCNIPGVQFTRGFPIQPLSIFQNR